MGSHSSKYELVQMLWGILSARKEVRDPCTTCSGKGKVVIGGETFLCPSCHGRCEIRRVEPQAWRVTDFGEVGRIETQVTSERFAERCSEGEPNPCVRYMLDSTGVGSGTLWSEATLWPSRNEAQAECDRLNAAESLESHAQGQGVSDGQV